MSSLAVRVWNKTSASIFAWVFALAATSLAVWFVGDKPLLVLKVLATSAFGGAENFSYTLFYATPMLLTGTAVALALEAGLFNIGAEGQLYMGAVAAATWGYYTRGWFGGANASTLLLFLTIMGAAVASFMGGAVWGGIAGYLRTRRQTHEVIATIMLNFIALAFADWAVLNPLKNPETQSLETYWIAERLRTPAIWHHVTWSLPLAVLIAVTTLWAVKRTWWGFRVRATGQNQAAAHVAGISTQNTMLVSLALSGGIAGLVGFHEVFLHSYRMIDGFSPGFGFTGLAIALLARGSIPAIILASLLFGALHKGTLDLDLETEKVTRDLSAVIQALILVTLAARPKIASLLTIRKKEQ